MTREGNLGVLASFQRAPAVLGARDIADARVDLTQPGSLGWEFHATLKHDVLMFNFDGFASQFALNSDRVRSARGDPRTWNLHPAGTSVLEHDLTHDGDCLFVEYTQGILSPAWSEQAPHRRLERSLLYRRDERVTWLASELRRLVLQNRQGVATETIYAESLLATLAAAVADHLTEGHPRRNPLARLTQHATKQLVEHIEVRLHDGLSLAELAAFAGLPAHLFSRAFKDAVGLPPHQFVLDRRLHRARQLLESTDDPLAEIAYACGFASQSHMTDVFRARLGITPGRYRKERRS